LILLLFDNDGAPHGAPFQFASGFDAPGKYSRADDAYFAYAACDQIGGMVVPDGKPGDRMSQITQGVFQSGSLVVERISFSTMNVRI
jgi:hypothetical protein